MLRGWGFGRVLPLVMTVVQLGLLAMSLAENWHLPTNPGELHRRLPPTVPTVTSDGSETVSFEMPRERKTSAVLKVATVLSLPAMFCGAIVGLPLLLLGLEGGDAMWIALSALFGIVTWRQIGRWADEQRAISQGTFPVQSKGRVALRSLMRFVVIFFLALFVLNVTFVRHHRTAEADFLCWTWIAWSSVYLLLSLWGGRREMRLARVKAATCTGDEL